MSDDATIAVSSKRGVWQVPAAFAAAWVVFDGLFLDMGIPSILVAFLLTLIWLPFNLLSPRFKGRRGQRLIRYGLYMLAAVLAIGIKAFNSDLALTRAETLIAAVESYRTKTGSYPENLQQLVPEFASSIPRAKFVISDAGFRYVANPQGHELMYVAMPPFDRRIYRFESHEWRSID